MSGNGQEMVRKWSGNVRKWSGNVRKWSKMVRKWSKMIRKWSKMVRKWSKMVILHTCGLSAKGAKDSRIKRKRATILPISIVQSFFCVLFFSLCSNLSIWPVRQVVPDESRCYIPIFDGLVFIEIFSKYIKYFRHISMFFFP